MTLDALHAAVTELEHALPRLLDRAANAERMYAVTLQQLNETREALENLIKAARDKDADWAKTLGAADRLLLATRPE